MKNNQSMETIKIKDRFGVFFWRHILMPLITNIGGKNFPKGSVIEYNYGDHIDEKLDYIASNSAISKIAIVHIHGGAWVSGSKGKFYSKPLLKFSANGYPVFSLNYPLAPEQKHPHILKSLLRALAWIKKNFPQYDEIHLIGDSAGGNLAMMLGIFISNEELLSQLEGNSSIELPMIKSIVDLFGVNDRESWVEDGFPSAKLFSKIYFGQTQTPHIPIVPMDIKIIKNLPPLFIVGAGKDKLLRSSKIWYEAISKMFDTVEFKIYEKSDHGFFSFGEGNDELINDMIYFFNKNNK